MINATLLSHYPLLRTTSFSTTLLSTTLLSTAPSLGAPPLLI